MISQIHIKNIALIDEAVIEFKPGFNVLSGETGAGKSIIVDAMQLILGGRADKELIKTGTDKAFVQAELFVDDIAARKIEERFGIEIEDNVIILSRELTSSGKNTCRINYRATTLSILKEVCGMLVNLHGQNQTYSESHDHLRILDNFGDYGDAISDVKKAYAEYQNLSHKLDDMISNQAHKQRNIDMYQYQIQEIKAANLHPDEEDELEEKKNLMLHAEKIATSMQIADEAMQEAMGFISSASSQLESIADLSQDYQNLSQTLNDIYYSAQDVAYEITGNKPETEFSTSDIDEAEERLNAIHTLKRKYGETIEDILAFADECEEKLDELLSSETYIDELKEKVTKSEIALNEKCAVLCKKRKAAAELLDRSMIEHLKELGMSNAQFESRFIPLPASAKGTADMEFYITVNKGEPLKPMSKVASGGEMSRIMLALKTIMASKDGTGTLIFDEIDTGISGNMANVVARKMYKITQSAQVICVTHLAQIAAMADTHFLITKNSDAERTYTHINELGEQEATREIARLTGGMDSDIALKHAQEILDTAKKFKK